MSQPLQPADDAGVAFAAGVASAEAEQASEDAAEAEAEAEQAEAIAGTALDVAMNAGDAASEAQDAAAEAQATAEMATFDHEHVLSRLAELERRFDEVAELDAAPAADGDEAKPEPTMIEVEKPDADETTEQRSEEESGSGQSVGDPPSKSGGQRRGFKRGRRG